jgi:hypothetical protein
MRRQYGHESWYRHVAAAGGVINILFMMSANLVGFVLGLDGMKHLVRELAQTPQGWSLLRFLTSCISVHSCRSGKADRGRMGFHLVLVFVSVCGRTSDVRVSGGGEAARHRQAVLDEQHEMGSHDQADMCACATEKRGHR